MGLKFFRTSKAGTTNKDSHITSMTASNVWAHLNPLTNYAGIERPGVEGQSESTGNLSKVFITLHTTGWTKNASWSEANRATDNGWTKDTSAGRTIRIRQDNMYLVTPVTLSAAYDSASASQVYYLADGSRVKTAKAGDTVYTETMVDETLTPTTDAEQSPGLNYLFTKGLDKNGDAVVYFKRVNAAGEAVDYTPDFMDASNWTSAPVYSYTKKQVAADGTKTFDIFQETARETDHAPLTIQLNEGEFVTSYTLDLGPYGGDADSTAETARAYDGDAGSGQQTSDYAVLGRPFIYKGQNNKIYQAGSTDKDRKYQSYIDNAISTAKVDYNHFYTPTAWRVSNDKNLYSYNSWTIANSYRKEFNSVGAGYRWVPRNSAVDTAWMVGYKVTYGSAPVCRPRTTAP